MPSFQQFKLSNDLEGGIITERKAMSHRLILMLAVAIKAVGTV